MTEDVIVMLTGIGVLIATGAGAVFAGLSFGLLRRASKPAVSIHAVRNTLPGAVAIDLNVRNPSSFRFQIEEVVIHEKNLVDIVPLKDAMPWVESLVVPRDKPFVADAFPSRGPAIKLATIVPSVHEPARLAWPTPGRSFDGGGGLVEVKLSARWRHGSPPENFAVTVRLKELRLGGQTIKVRGRVPVVG